MMAQGRIPYELRQLTISQGLPDNMVYNCFQDSQGYIWFCTANGVSRYDGRKFQNFSVADGLADNENLTATEDSKGRIWFHSINGRISYFDTKTERIVSYRTSSSLNKANQSTFLSSITEGSDGSIWILSTLHLLERILPNGEVRQYNLQNKRYMGVHKDAQNRIFLAGETFKLFDEQRDSFVDWVEFLPEMKKQKWRIWKFSHDAFFLELKDGIFELKDNVFRKILDKNLLKNQLLRSISADSMGNMWLGVTNGFYSVDLNNKKPVRFFPTKSHVAHVFMDNEGNKWVCTLGEGVFFLPPDFDNISILGKVNGLESAEVTALARSPQNDLVVATYPSVLQFLDKNRTKIQRKIKIEGMWDVRVKQLIFPNEKDFWIQTDNNRINYFPNFSKKKHLPFSLNETNIKEILKIGIRMPNTAVQYEGKFAIFDFLSLDMPFKNI